MQVKLFAIGLALVVGCVTPTVVADLHREADEQAQQQAAERSTDQLTLAHELPGTPPDVVATFVDLLAEGGSVAADESCLMFDAYAARQFAAANDQPTCRAAMRRLQGQITDKRTYADGLTVPGSAWTQADSTATVDGCDVTWSGLSTTPVSAPGPLPGLLILTELDTAGWQIIDYEPC